MSRGHWISPRGQLEILKYGKLSPVIFICNAPHYRGKEWVAEINRWFCPRHDPG